jgi:fatty-acyl-CoA synthase
MEAPLTPLEFMRRSRRLYAGREAVVDGAHRWSYAEFFERCERWSVVLQRMGVQPGDRVAAPTSPDSEVLLLVTSDQ